jgi:hypothetical protein
VWRALARSLPWTRANAGSACTPRPRPGPTSGNVGTLSIRFAPRVFESSRRQPKGWHRRRSPTFWLDPKSADLRGFRVSRRVGACPPLDPFESTRSSVNPIRRDAARQFCHPSAIVEWKQNKSYITSACLRTRPCPSGRSAYAPVADFGGIIGYPRSRRSETSAKALFFDGKRSARCGLWRIEGESAFDRRPVLAERMIHRRRRQRAQLVGSLSVWRPGRCIEHHLHRLTVLQIDQER